MQVTLSQQASMTLWKSRIANAIDSKSRMGPVFKSAQFVLNDLHFIHSARLGGATGG
jgi:hypothetical protein